MCVELGGGIYAHSLAIVTDAAHLLSDVSGFAVSLFAAYYAAKKSHVHFSYGYHRIEVLGALASILSVWLVTGILLWEAVQRVINPEPVNGKVMFILAVIGVFVNIMLMVVLGGHGHSHGDAHDHDHEHSEESSSLLAPVEEGRRRAGDAVSNHRKHEGHNHAHGDRGDDPDELIHVNVSQRHGDREEKNINVQSAFIHVLGDLVQSVGVAVAGALIWWHQDDPRWALADPICTFLFAALVLWTTFSILRNVGDVLMERAPRGTKVDVLVDNIMQIDDVCDVHDLHVWSLTPGIPLLCAHVVVDSARHASRVLHDVTRYCRAQGIEHTTVQLEVGEACCPCGTSRGNSMQSSTGSLASTT